MNPADFPDLPPRRKPFKVLVSRVVLFALGRALQSLSKHDALMQDEVKRWAGGFTLVMVLRPNLASMAVRHIGDGRLQYLGAHFPEDKADVVIYMKNVEIAFALLSGQVGIDVGYARHSMCARGDLSNSVSVVRVLNIAETYLFPSFIAKKLMKRMPPISPVQKYALRLKAYFLGVPFGV